MTSPLRLGVMLSTLAMAVPAFASADDESPPEPLDPYSGPATPLPPAPPPAIVAPAGSAVIVAPAPAAHPVNPYPAPSAYGYQAPAGQPVPSTPPAYQNGYYLYPQQGGHPVYYAPPSGYRAQRPVGCGASCVRAPERWDGVRRFSLGLHGMMLALDQRVGNNDVVLGGVGFQMRVRSQGRFGFEASQWFLHAEYWRGGFERDSFPFQLSMLFYLFPNTDAHHLNFYAIAGVGAMPDTVTLYDQSNQRVRRTSSSGKCTSASAPSCAAVVRHRDRRALHGPRARQRRLAGGVLRGRLGRPGAVELAGVQGNLYVSFWF